MGKIKRKEAFTPRRYWRIFVPLALILLLCLRFSIRITIPDLYDDILLYGLISLVSWLSAWRIYHRSKWMYRRLLAIVCLCGVLAGWQVIDLGILRDPNGGMDCFCSYITGRDENYFGGAWYDPLFHNPEILCHSIYELYIGNQFMAITLETKHTSWFACGG